MSKQTPMLMESPLTKRVFVVTSYKDKGDGIFEARQKYDVTEQFDALAERRSGTCELTYGENDDGIDGWYTQCGGWFAVTREDKCIVNPIFCQKCGKKVER